MCVSSYKNSSDSKGNTCLLQAAGLPPATCVRLQNPRTGKAVPRCSQLRGE